MAGFRDYKKPTEAQMNSEAAKLITGLAGAVAEKVVDNSIGEMKRSLSKSNTDDFYNSRYTSNRADYDYGGALEDTQTGTILRDLARKSAFGNINPYLSEAKQSLPNEFYRSRYSSTEDEPRKQLNMTDQEREAQEWLLNNTFEENGAQVKDRLQRNAMTNSEWNKYADLYNSGDKAGAENYINSIRNELQVRADGSRDNIARKEVEQKKADDLTTKILSSPQKVTVSNKKPDHTYEWTMANAADTAYRAQMSDKEIEAYRKLYNTQGEKAAEDYYNKILGTLKRKDREQRQEAEYKFGKENPALATIGSVGKTLLQPVEILPQIGGFLSGNLDENDILNSMITNEKKYQRQGASDLIGKKYGALAQFGYGVGTSMADFLATMAAGNLLAGGSILSSNIPASAQELSEWLSLGIMGTNAASETILESKEKGASDGEAMALGAIAGAAEIITEKVSIDALLNAPASMRKGDLAKYIAKNALSEGSEEVASDMINMVADVLIKGDRDERNLRYNELLEEGKTPQEAFGIVLAEQATQVGLDFVGGALSGGILGAGGAVNYSRNSKKISNNLDLQNNVQTLISDGLAQDPSSEAYQLATRLQGVENPSDTELVGLLSATDEAQRNAFNEEFNKAVQEAAEKIESNEVARYIFENDLDIDKGAQSVMEMMWDESQPVETYIPAMMDYYIAGVANENMDDVESAYGDNLTEYQKQAIYNQGKEDYNAISVRESEQRNSSENTEEPISTMEEGTRGIEEGKSTPIQRPEIIVGQSYKSSEVVDDGNDTEVKVVEGGKNEKWARQRVESYGLTPHFFEGELGFKDGSSASAYIDGNDVWISVNDPDFTSFQLADHEICHHLISKGNIDVKAVKKMLDSDSFDELKRLYEEAYNGVEMSDDDVAEEIICDSYARMNRFKNRSTQLEKKYQPFYNVASENTRNSEQKANAPPKEEQKKNQSEIKEKKKEKTGDDWLNVGEEGEVKFSKKFQPFEELVKENRELKKSLEEVQTKYEAAKRELKITSPLQVRPEDIGKVAKSLKKQYSSSMTTGDIAYKVRMLGEYILNASNDKTVTPEEYSSNVKSLAVDLASDLIKSSREMVTDFPESNEILRYLQRGVSIDPSDARNIPDFREFKNSNRNNVRIVSNGLPVDVAYQELNEMFPSWFPDSITAPSDQLLRMAEIGEYMQPIYANPFEFYALDVSAIVEEAANEIVENTAYGQLRATNPTFADKVAKELSAAKKQIADLKEENKALSDKANSNKADNSKVDKSKVDKMIADLKEKQKKEIQSLKKHNSETKRRERDRRKSKELRDSIKKRAEELSTKLLSPSNTKHITERYRGMDGKVESLRSVVAKVLQCINLESNFEYEEGSKKHAKEGVGVATQRTLAFRDLLHKYRKLADEGVIASDEALKSTNGWIEDIIAFKDTPLANLGYSELQKIDYCLTSLENTLTKANRMLSTEKEERVDDFLYPLFSENEGKRAKDKSISTTLNNLSIGMLTPQAFFERLGKVGDSIFRLLRNGQDKRTLNIKVVMDWYKKLKTQTKLKETILDKQAHQVVLGGRQVALSTSALMDLYVTARRKQGLFHILDGGIRLEGMPVKEGLFKRLKVSGAETIERITPYELDMAFAHLTPEQIYVAEQLQQFVSTTLSQMGNEASLKVYGYEKFTEPNYWRINVHSEDRSHIGQGVESRLPTSVSGKGIAQPVIEEANNPITIRSIFDEFLESAVDMCDYAAYLDVMEDVNRIRNYNYIDEYGNRHSVEKLVNRVVGEQGARYWEKLMQDLSSSIRSDKTYFGGMMGKFKSAAVGANLRVIVQQPTAILRAASLIDYKYLLMGLKNPMKGSKKSMQFAPIALWKDWGHFDINTGRSLRDLILGAESPLQKFNEVLMRPAGLADNFAWGILWNAVEAETKAKTNLRVGTKEYYDHVASRFTEIVDRTQVVDGILQRSEIMRSGDKLNKMAASFMGEPIKQYNQLMSSIYNFQQNKSPATRKALARNIISLLMAGMLNATVKSLVDAMRHNTRDKDYWEQFLEEMIGLSGDEKTPFEKGAKFITSGNVGDIFNLPAYIPFVKDFEQVLLGYDIKRTDMSVFEDMVKAANNMIKALGEEGNKQNPIYSVMNFLSQSAKIFGVSVANLDRDAKALQNMIINNIGNYALIYDHTKRFTNVDNKNTKSEYKKILYDAYKSGDTNAFNYILDDLRTHGYSDDDFRKAFQEGLKSDQGVDKVEELTERTDIALFPTAAEKKKAQKAGISIEEYARREANGQNSSDSTKSSSSKSSSSNTSTDYKNTSTYKAITSSDVWKQATPAMRQETEETLRKLAKGEDKATQKKINAAKQYGKSESDLLSYYLALQVVDKPNANGKMGTYTNAERQQAASMTGFTLDLISKINKDAK